ncbi:hypothetical protein [Maricaulis sp.]|uniref:hypothetical protein n=1 Tax=Maricaulis sp. TaxID=1486257 RepID=UPI003298128D
MSACSTPRSVSPPPTIEPEIREVERIVREEIETPPSTCLMPPHDLAAVQPGRDWRDVALDAGEAAITNARIARACQEWWARVEASRTEEESS